MLVKLIRYLVYFIVQIVWLVVGFLVWIPLLIKVILIYSSALVFSMITDSGVAKEASALETSTTFYIDGFIKIHNSMFISSNINDQEKNSNEGFYDEEFKAKFKIEKSFRDKNNYDGFNKIVFTIIWTLIYWGFMVYLYKNV